MLEPKGTLAVDFDDKEGSQTDAPNEPRLTKVVWVFDDFHCLHAQA